MSGKNKQQYWLMKSEPGCYSIDDLERDGVEMWDGIRNYQVRNMLRDQMQVGDRAFFYHSNAGVDTGIVGEMEIISEAYADPTQFDLKSEHPDPKSDPNNPRWLCVDVKFIQKFSKPVWLSELRLDPKCSGMPVLQKGSRLSVTPVSPKHYSHVLKLAS